MIKYICPICHTECDTSHCPKCNKDFIDKEANMKNGLLSAIISILVLIVGFIILYNVAGFSSSSSTDDYKSDAYAVAQHYVEEKLKAPKTADFPWYDESYVTVSGNKYTVSAYVDAENSFGANVRTYFTVTMTRNGDNWENIKVTFK